MHNKGLIAAVVIAVLLVGGYFIFAAKMTPFPTQSLTEQKEASEVSREERSSKEGEVKEITVEADEYSFSPETLTFTKGQKVRLTFKNVGSQPHNFVIDGMGVASKTIPEGSSDTVGFTASESGTFEFYCAIGNHRALGMEGNLEVE